MLRYERGEGTGRVAVVLNLGAEAREVDVGRASVLVSTHLDCAGPATQPLTLRPDEGIVVSIGENAN